MLRRPGLWMVWVVLSLSWPSFAAPPPVIHEYFEYPSAGVVVDDALLELPEPGLIPPAGDAGVGGRRGAATLLTPDGPLPPRGFLDESVGGTRNGPTGAGGDVSLDRETGPEQLLRYQATFDPTVAPWKRVGTRDSVLDDGLVYTLVVGDAEHLPVRVGGSPGATDEQFRATFAVVAHSDRPIPIPSVAPEMRIHRLAATPSTGVRVTRDGAGSFYAWLETPGSALIEVEVSADSRYFGGSLPAPGLGPRAPLAPERLVGDASLVLEAAEVRSDMTDVEVVTLLLRYFRGFEARPFPAAERTDNIYLDIALGRIGVCRHRAMAFTLTALAAGIPTRYVYNEAHAFVEVRFEAGFWRRFDLGGAAEDFQILGGEPGRRHEPPLDPTLEGATAESSYSNELGPDAFAPPTPGPPNPTRQPQETLAGAGDRAATSEQPAATAPRSETSARRLEPLVAPEATTGEETSHRAATRLTANLPTGRVFRGDAITVSGVLTAGAGSVLANRTIEVWLGPADSGDGDGVVRWIGSLETDDDGRFADEVVLPATIAPGPWGLYVTFSGDAEHLPCHGR